MPRGVYERTERYRQKMAKAMLGNKNSTGYVMPPEHREKIRKALLSFNQEHPEHGEKTRQTHLGRKRSADTRAKLRAAMLGKHPSPETREKMRQSRLRYVHPKKMTRLELSLLEQFKKRRLKFEMHKTMFGRFQPDFVFEQARLIVEADGDYWHRVLHRNHQPLADAASKEGWTVWRFAESQIRMHPESCGKSVARYIHSYALTP